MDSQTALRLVKNTEPAKSLSKAAFIESLPDLPASEVVRLAALAGVKTDIKYVYNTRTRAAKASREAAGLTKPLSKAAFIKSLPDLPASEVVRLATLAGVETSIKYVCNTRTRAAKASPKTTPKVSTKATASQAAPSEFSARSVKLYQDLQLLIGVEGIMHLLQSHGGCAWVKIAR